MIPRANSKHDLTDWLRSWLIEGSAGTKGVRHAARSEDGCDAGGAGVA